MRSGVLPRGSCQVELPHQPRLRRRVEGAATEPTVGVRRGLHAAVARLWRWRFQSRRRAGGGTAGEPPALRGRAALPERLCPQDLFVGCPVRVRALDDRKCDGKSRPFAQTLRLPADVAVMEVDDVAGDGEAEAEAASFG